MAKTVRVSTAAATASLDELTALARRVRTYTVRATTAAGSGHVTSSFSATELMVALFFHRLRADLARPDFPNNDRVIFSKGHASPLLYSLYATAGAVPLAELDTLRRLGSPLEGHPTPNFPYAEAATGSLGQGLSVGVGIALNARYLDHLPYVTWVLLGDGEMAEGSVWEAAELAAYHKLGNLVALVDVNRLGQSGPTMLQHHTEIYRARLEAFGWKVVTLDGHDLEAIVSALDAIDGAGDRPTALVARTLKGKGVSFLEDKEGWHGKALTPEQAKQAYAELGPITDETPAAVAPPEDRRPMTATRGTPEGFSYAPGEKVATRKAYGKALARLGKVRPEIVALDGDVKNSTFSEDFLHAVPDRFFEMYIAEQNMVGAAVGLSSRGKTPFVSTFAAFLTRAADQIRMAVYSRANIKFAGSHVGVSIGEDGPSQMGLEDLALFRALGDSVVLYPCDAVSAERCVELLADHRGIAYLRTTRPATPVIYGSDATFRIGGSRIVKSSGADRATVVAAGITVFQALAAAEQLASRGVAVRVLDAYSVKPIDGDGIRASARETGGRIVIVEDHYPEGGLGEAVLSALAGDKDLTVRHLAVRGLPGSGPEADTMRQAGIDAGSIARALESLVSA